MGMPYGRRLVWSMDGKGWDGMMDAKWEWEWEWETECECESVLACLQRGQNANR
jgi:hypothetical protein